MRPLPRVTIKSGREKPLTRRHPWVFSGAIQRAENVPPGTIVDVRSAEGAFLARGYYNEASQIRVRALTFDENEAIDAAFFRRKLKAALDRRESLLVPGVQTGARLVMSEADGLPGLIVDRYGDHLVLQALTAGIDVQLPVITEALRDLADPHGIHERSDDAVRELEGLPRRNALLHGQPPEGGRATILENGLAFSVDLTEGHKTGHYLDQGVNHRVVRDLAKDRHVLDCFSYTGGFSVHAAAGGAASVRSVDASQPALALAAANMERNGFAGDRYGQVAGNAFELLRAFRDAGEMFDMIVLDPPKFAQNASQVDKATRGYKDLNLLAFKLLNPGGILATFSCSGHISPDLFQKVVFGAAVDANTDAQIISYLFQAPDHPVLLSFPESLYLKGLLCRVV